MKKTSPTGHTIRFRRWSRKAYAAFASIGRCVTIGCLRKSVADSSLSKQKAVGNAGHTGCGEESVWKGETKGRENDIGIPPGSDTLLTNIFTELRSNEPTNLEAHVVSHVSTWGKSCAYTTDKNYKKTLEHVNTWGESCAYTTDKYCKKTLEHGNTWEELCAYTLKQENRRDIRENKEDKENKETRGQREQEVRIIGNRATHRQVASPRQSVLLSLSKNLIQEWYDPTE